MVDQLQDRVDPTQRTVSVQSLEGLLGVRNRPTVLRRLRWIEDRLWWLGAIRRADVVSRFEISPQQASQDIAAYQHARPGLAELDLSSKAYLKVSGEQPLFPKDPFRFISEEMSDGSQVLPLERLPNPGRRVDQDVMAALMAAFDVRRSITIGYQSLSRGETSARPICPHHIVDTGRRYHVRAWDGLRGQFADFVIGRIVSVTPSPDYPWVDGLADQAWQDTVSIVVAPAQGLTKSQRHAVEQDYGMRNGQAEFRVRQALVTYAAELLGLLDEIQHGVAARTRRELRCVNASELRPLVPSSGPEG